MIQAVEAQLEAQAKALEAKAESLRVPIVMENFPTNAVDSQTESFSFPRLSEHVAVLATEFLRVLGENPFIKKREGKDFDNAVKAFVLLMNNEGGLKIDFKDPLDGENQEWAANCTVQMIPNSVYREGASLHLQKFVFEKFLEVFSGQKDVLEIDVVDFPAVNLYHRHETSANDFYQADGASFLEYACLRNLFSLLDVMSGYAQQADFKIKVNIRVEDAAAQDLYNLGETSDFEQTQQAYEADIINWQQQILSHYPKLASKLELNWLSEKKQAEQDQNFEETIAVYESKILRFWLKSEKIYQQILEENGLDNWSKVKIDLSGSVGVDDELAKDLDASLRYRRQVKTILDENFAGQDFYDHLPGKESFLQLLTPIEKEALLRQVASVIGQENASYMDLTFNRDILRATCNFLAKKIYFAERRQAEGQNIALSFGQSLPDKAGASKVIILKPLGSLPSKPNQGSLALNRGADFAFKAKGVGGSNAIETQPKETAGTVVVASQLNLSDGAAVPVFLRLSPVDLQPSSSQSHLLQARSPMVKAAERSEK